MMGLRLSIVVHADGKHTQLPSTSNKTIVYCLEKVEVGVLGRWMQEGEGGCAGHSGGGQGLAKR